MNACLEMNACWANTCCANAGLAIAETAMCAPETAVRAVHRQPLLGNQCKYTLRTDNIYWATNANTLCKR